MIILSFWCVLLFTYLIFVTLLFRSWNTISFFELDKEYKASVQISVLIPVKNEAENIENLLLDLNQQSYEHFEVIVINDESDDNTLEILNRFSSNFSLTILDLKASEKAIPYKKGAIAEGLKKAQGELIVTTDGDCRVGKDWLKTYAEFYEQKQAKFIIGAVTFHQEKNWFERIQTIEFASLIGSGASFLQMKYPNMCNGANLAYSKEICEEVNQYEGNEKIASGDDEFLMHKIYEKYSTDVHFLKSSTALVHTKAQASWKSFYHQRKRWASKWNHYKFNYITLLALGVLLLNFILAIAPIFVCFEILSIQWLLLGFAFRFWVDYLYLNCVSKFLRKKIRLLDYLILSILYVYYVAFFGLVANIGGYQWKKQEIRK
ncbi:MAG: glycosyltransferase [Cytophagales bacterium]|nr:glycosyltransferase [Cytophagales bacterium]